MKSISLFNKSIIIGSLAGLSLAIFSDLPTFATNDWDAAIAGANAFATSIETMVTAFATVAIGPIGLSAATKCFKHIVIGNM